MSLDRREYRHQYYLANKDRTLSLCRLWQKRNKDKCRKAERDYSKRYPYKMAAKEAKHRASKLLRTPSWLSESQLHEIKQIYLEANELSWLSEGGLHVDHIVPLRGHTVSGLHVPWNLQILPASTNSSKGNRF